MSPELYDFQEEGVDFLATQKRAILGDDMGLGKTPQALRAAERLDAFPMLVVCPKSATGVWMREAEKWLGITPNSYTGQNRKLDKDPAIVITSYVGVEEISSRLPFRLTVFDEAHKLRNGRIRAKPNKKSGESITPHLFLAAKKVKSPYMFHLTGSPIINDADDLWPLLHLANPYAWKSYWAYVNKYMFKDNNGFGWKVHDVKDPVGLRRDLERYMLRRKKTDVLLQLPEKRRVPWDLQMTPTQKRHYDNLVKEMMTELTDGGDILAVPSKLALLTRLRQLLVTPRLLGIDEDGAAIEAIAEHLTENPHPAVVFTPFAQAIPHIHAALNGQPVWEVSGKLSDRQLSAVTTSYQNSSAPNKVLISTVQMGTSWEATSASNAYFLGYDWSPDINIQSEDRLHRHGQFNPVLARYFTYEETIDQHLMNILERKTTVKKLVLDAEAFLRGRAA
jgi:SWI/SNF-related matrix-associated actin-dependent regulator of chromatin subfamily A-like protein 1